MRMQELENNLMEYFNNNLTPSDRVKVEEWAGKSKENQLVFDQVRQLHELSGINEEFEPNVDAAWNRIQSKLFEKREGKQFFIGLKYIYRVAAVLVLAMSIGILSYVVSSSDLTVVTTAYGERQEVSLPDGTIILLNENSALKYDDDFDEIKRIVYLNGQAFFNVARDEERPFEIIGKSASISVLGTSFDYVSGDGYAQVNVNSGKVAFRNNFGGKQELILTENQQGKLINNELTKLETLDEKVVAWRFDELVFKSAPLSQVIVKLTKYYNVEFEIDPTIENCLITTSFRDQSIDEVLNILRVIANIKNERSGKVIKLTGPGC